MEFDEEQDRVWKSLYNAVVEVLEKYGQEDHFGEADYLVVDDNYGWKQVKVEIHRLNMLHPEVVSDLKSVVNQYPGWQIVLAVDVPGTEGSWPLMGVTIRPHEIIDGLHREVLPSKFETLRYAGSRPGTGYD